MAAKREVARWANLVTLGPDRFTRQIIPMITFRTRIVSAAVAQCLAIVSFCTASFVFSGDVERYAKFVATQNGHLIVAGALMGFALVVSVPVCWRGSNLQRLVALVLIVNAAVALAFLYDILF